MDFSVGKRVLIVEPRDIVRIGLYHIITLGSEMNVCALSRTLSQARRIYDGECPDVVVIDATMESSAGFDFIRDLRRSSGNVKIVIFSRPLTSEEERRGSRSGANAVVSHQDSQAAILDTLIAVTNGGLYRSPRSIAPVDIGFSTHLKSHPPETIDLLSKREAEIFQLLGEGKTTKEIALLLKLSVKTIETSGARMKVKLSVKTMHDLRQLSLRSAKIGND